MRKIITSLFISLAVLLYAFPLEVAAHAVLLESNPSQNATVQVAPKQVHLHFSEQLNPEMIQVKISNSSKQSIPTSVKLAPTDPSMVIVTLPNLAKGTYTVTWSVLSDDGHPVNGDFAFAYGQKLATTAGASTSAHPLTTLLLVVLRYVNESWLLISAGLVWVSFFAAKRGLPAWKWEANILIKSSIAMVWLGIQICIWFLYALELPENLLNTWIIQGQFTQLTQVPFVIVLLIQTFLYALLLIPNMVTGWYLLLSLFLTATFAFNGHVWSSPFFNLAWLARVLHLWSAAFWMGSLAYLLYLCVPHQKKLIRTLKQFRPFFSRMALIASSLLIISGILLVTAQTDWAAVWGFHQFWSRFLLIKMLLVVGMLIYAGLQNRQWKNAGTLEQDSLRTEWLIGLIALLFGIWMSQIAYPILPQ